MALWSACTGSTDPCGCDSSESCIDGECVPRAHDLERPGPEGLATVQGGDASVPESQEALGQEQRLYQLAPGADRWISQPLSDVFNVAGGPPVRGITTAFASCEDDLLCFGTETAWFCGDHRIRSWTSGAWPAGLPEFRSPTFAAVSPPSAPLAGRLVLSSGERWWRFAASNGGSSAIGPYALEASFSDSESHDDTWARDAQAPRRASDVRADWVDRQPDGGGTWNLLTESGRRHQLFLSSDGHTARWLQAGPEPRLSLPQAPEFFRVNAGAVDCEGRLLLVVTP